MNLPLAIGGKWRYKHGITVLQWVVDLNFPVVIKAELDYIYE